jgi:hypothetical protein
MSVTDISPSTNVACLVKDLIPDEGLVIAFGHPGADASVWSAFSFSLLTATTIHVKLMSSSVVHYRICSFAERLTIQMGFNLPNLKHCERTSLASGASTANTMLT